MKYRRTVAGRTRVVGQAQRGPDQVCVGGESVWSDRGRRGSSNAGPLIGSTWGSRSRANTNFVAFFRRGSKWLCASFQTALSSTGPRGSDGTREANCRLCLCASADWRWLVLAPEDFSNGCSTRGLSWTPWIGGGSDDRAWRVLAVGGPYQGHSKQRRLVPPHRHQPLFRLLEFLSALGP